MTATRPDVFPSIIDAIGETPLIELSRFLERDDVKLVAKLESSNPGGSAKDRPALRMIREARRNELIDDQTTVVESSSGNMGIGLAQVCRCLGLRFVCIVDPQIQSENVKILQALGAEVHFVTRPINGSFLAARLEAVQQFVERTSNVFWPNQYANQRNPEAHQLGTIVEIDQALGGQFDSLFVATSSTGTLQGVQRYLRARRRLTKVVAVDAIGSALFGGDLGPRKIPGLGAGQVSALAEQAEPDLVCKVSETDCVVGCRRLAMKEAILAGGSAGGVLQSVRAMQHELAGQTCVVILHDSGTRYLDTIFSDKWVTESLGTPIDELKTRVDDIPLVGNEMVQPV